MYLLITKAGLLIVNENQICVNKHLIRRAANISAQNARPCQVTNPSYPKSIVNSDNGEGPITLSTTS